jgi:hypothetical protein
MSKYKWVKQERSVSYLYDKEKGWVEVMEEEYWTLSEIEEGSNVRLS